MEWIIKESVIKCAHLGVVDNVNSQDWVRIVHDDEPVPVLVDDDPQGRDINGCPNSGAYVKKCSQTLEVKVGYSEWIRIDGKAIVLSHLDGLTNGTPPKKVPYNVTDPKQLFVRADA